MKANIDLTPHLKLDFDPSGFKVDDVAKAIEDLMGKLGCTGCGRLSVHIQALEDPEWVRLDGIPSLREVTLLPERALFFGR